jgi:hypothetical protein
MRVDEMPKNSEDWFFKMLNEFKENTNKQLNELRQYRI